MAKDFGKTIFDTSIKKIKEALDGEKEKGTFLKDIVKKKEHPIDRTPYIIGRSEDCALTILDDNKVSRIHCVINKRGNTFIIEDLGSTNGILINEKPLQKGIIKNGDLITIGDTIFLLVEKK